MTGTYAFDNAHSASTNHHQALSDLLDPVSLDRIGGLTDLTGKRIWDVGAGGGALARRLAELVGPTGRVLATDLKATHLGDQPNLETLQHDVVNDELPDGQFDVIHTRLLLNHLPPRRAVLTRLAGALAPGGFLVTEDQRTFDPATMVASAPTEDDAKLYVKYQQALFDVLTAHGNDRGWSLRAAGAYVEEGLVDVRVTVAGQTWHGGGPGCLFQQVGLLQVADELVEQGLSQDEQRQVYALLDDPRLIIHGHLLYSTSGRRPADGEAS